MIDNNTTANPTLTFDQLQAIDVAQKTLANLQSEITNATKVLKGTKMESDRAVKEKVYQEELLSDLTLQVESKTITISTLDKDIDEKTTSLNELLSQFKEHTDLMASEKASHDERESKISEKEQQLSNLGNALGKKEIILNNDKADFNSKVATLKEVISKF
jgi:hypothetical protein